MARKVKIFTTPTCPWCDRVKDFLEGNGVEFDEVDVSSDHKALAEMVEKSGQMGVPVIDIDGKIIVGFNQEAIEKELSI